MSRKRAFASLAKQVFAVRKLGQKCNTPVKKILAKYENSGKNSYEKKIMDMGEILAQWDAMQDGKNSTIKSVPQKTKTSQNKSSSSKKSSTAIAKSSQKITHEQMNLWLDTHGVQDKDRTAHERQQHQQERATNYANLAIDETLDLHGLTQEESESALETFISNAKRHGSRKVLIIHGKGIHSQDGYGVLGRLVQNFIERDKRCGASGHPKNTEGATGATWVVLK